MEFRVSELNEKKMCKTYGKPVEILKKKIAREVTLAVETRWGIVMK